MNFFRKIKIAVLCLLLPAMILLAGNAVFNWHVHKRADGTVMVHAHPYQKTNNPDGTTGHHHSSKECFLLQQVSTFLFFIAAIFSIAALIGKAFTLQNLYHFFVKAGIIDALLPNRAPPAFA